MSYSCVLFLFLTIVNINLVFSAPDYSVFQRNGLQREQESVLIREPFEPQSPFQLPSQSNVPNGNIVVPPTINSDQIDSSYQNVGNGYTNVGTTGTGAGRHLQNHFETLNKDALVGLLIEKHIPFYVKTVIDPQKPIQTKIHVMRIPKKYEITSPLPIIDLNMVEIMNANSSEITEQEQFKTEDAKQIETLVKANQKIQNHEDSIVKVTDRRLEDYSVEEKPIITVTGNSEKEIKSNNEEQNMNMQNDEPIGTDPSTTVVYEHAIIYTPEKRNDSKSIWEQIGTAFDKAKEKTSIFVDKAKDKTGELFEKAKEKAKDVLESNDSKNKEKSAENPADDI